MSLPEMACHPQARIDVAGVVAVDVAEGAPQAVLIRRDCHGVHVVGHQAVGPDLHSGPAGCLGKEIKIERIIAILEERLFATVAPLGDVVGNAGKDQAGKATHMATICGRRLQVNSLGIYAPVTVIR